ncbi:hypothetical protein C8R45DRAFT_1067803 [Mycena sanguinolenta]|nr:hypothetical protein C8R45DRAFT_1067803 [Mycena sanguinolenta]
MSPTLWRAGASFEFAIEGKISARSESAAQLSPDAWQIVGIVLVILFLGGLMGGGIWWETRAKLAEETELLASEGKTTSGPDDTPELELEVQTPQKNQNVSVSENPTADTPAVGDNHNGQVPVIVENFTWPRSSRKLGSPPY